MIESRLHVSCVFDRKNNLVAVLPTVGLVRSALRGEQLEKTFERLLGYKPTVVTKPYNRDVHAYLVYYREFRIKNAIEIHKAACITPALR